MSARETARARERERARAFLTCFPRCGVSVGHLRDYMRGPINTAAMQHSLAEAGVALTAAVSVINNYVEY